MRNSILGGLIGVLLGAVILAACGGGSSQQVTPDVLTQQVQQLTADLTALTARLDAHEADASAHHPAHGRLALNYCICTNGTYPSRNLVAPLIAGDPPAELAVDPLLGSVALFAGTFAPRGWALCDGSLLDISNNQALFSILGTNFGGDGRTTFGLPDLRGRAAVGVGSGFPLGSEAD